MGIETLGVRRLYDALGCGVFDGIPIQVSGLIGSGKNVSIYIGPTPPLGVMSIEADQYYVPGKQSKIMNTNIDYQSDCFLEIVLSFDYEATEKISSGLLKKDQESREYLLGIIKKESELFEKLIDSIVGIIGLKFHPQFTLKNLIENRLILSGPEPVSSFVGPSVKMLESVNLVDQASVLLNGYVKALESINDEVLAKAGGVFHWLIKAWSEKDPIAKFIYLFIPLEGILGSDSEMPNEAHKKIEILEELVKKTDSGDKEELLSFLDFTKKKYGPNLNARFEEFSQKSGIPGWEKDVEVFRKFNRMRNLLVHAGRKNISTHINIAEETRTLEDLVERYLCVAFLGGHEVYHSRWRPAR